MLTRLAETYSEVFAPEVFVLACTLALVAYEWRGESSPRPTELLPRLSVVVAGWAVAFAIYESADLLFDSVPAWGSDVTGSVGLGVGLLVIGVAWRRRNWGEHVPAFASLLFGVTAVHVVVTPFWGLSSHVAYTVAPAGYLSLADRRFAPLLAVAVGMVAARPLAGAHTWLQSVAGFVLAAGFLVGVGYRRWGPRSATARSSPE